MEPGWLYRNPYRSRYLLSCGAVISLSRPGGYLGLAWIAAPLSAAAAIGTLVGRPEPRKASGLGSSSVDWRLPFRDRGFVALLATNTVFALSTLFTGLTLPTIIKSGLSGPGWLTSGLLVLNALLVAVLGRRGGLLALRYHPFDADATGGGTLVPGVYYHGGCGSGKPFGSGINAAGVDHHLESRRRLARPLVQCTGQHFGRRSWPRPVSCRVPVLVRCCRAGRANPFCEPIRAGTRTTLCHPCRSEPGGSAVPDCDEPHDRRGAIS